MIQTQGFESIQSVGALADEINRWLANNSETMDSKFRLINIQYMSTAEPSPRYSTGKGPEIRYSALALYDIIEVKKTEETTEPLEASGVE
jgi:hypothetical protein